jgi:tetratricopeptide (TPR) repeat protein
MSTTDKADALKAEGNALFKAENYKEAIKKYKEAIGVAPSAALYTNRAQCYVRMNRFRDALMDCDNALTLDRTWARAYIRKAECHMKLKEYEQAIETLAGGIGVLPGDKDMPGLLAEARIKEAQELCQASFRMAFLTASPLLTSTFQLFARCCNLLCHW